MKSVVIMSLLLKANNLHGNAMLFHVKFFHYEQGITDLRHVYVYVHTHTYVYTYIYIVN